MSDFVRLTLQIYAQQRRKASELYFGVKADLGFLRRLFGYLRLRSSFVTADKGRTYTLQGLKRFFVLIQTKTELILTMPIFRPLLDERLSSCSDENVGSAEKESSYELTNSVASHPMYLLFHFCLLFLFLFYFFCYFLIFILFLFFITLLFLFQFYFFLSYYSVCYFYSSFFQEIFLHAQCLKTH